MPIEAQNLVALVSLYATWVYGKSWYALEVLAWALHYGSDAHGESCPTQIFDNSIRYAYSLGKVLRSTKPSNGEGCG